ncbi:MAG: hypothetical protein FGM24_06190 [Candidatus Kapabacteria bacterium]|nr:hypothetical protein [Candidatus Kapabacteria bacterium]
MQRRKTGLRRRRHTGRLIFTVLVIIAIIVLAVAIRRFLIDASMTLGGVVGTPSSGILSSMVVNQRTYVPPEDSLITPTQVAFLLRVVHVDDSLRREDASVNVFRAAMARHFNAHVMSMSEYQWTSRHAQQALVAARDYGLIDFSTLAPGIRRRFDRFLEASSIAPAERERVRAEADRMRIAAPLLIRRIHGDSLLFPDLSVEPYGIRKATVGASS